MTRCPHCDFQIQGHAPGATAPWECPQCGTRAPSEKNFVVVYFKTLWRLLTRPHLFFRSMPRQGGVSGPLTFALVTHWIGSALEYLWRNLLSGQFGSYFNELFKLAGDVADVDSPGRSTILFEMKDKMLHWIWGTGSVIIDPFLTLVSILFTSFFVWIGARILVSPGKNGAPEDISYESALRIVCFGLTPSILSALPLLGPLASTLLVWLVTIIGAREVYRIGFGRAAVVALFPKLLFLGTLLAGLAFAFFWALKMVASIL